jgi:hypothetical protein
MFTRNRAFFGLFYQSLMTNPTLTLIFLASLSLSFASGYTTWDGMTEFTNSSGLSLLMTAGLQGLMLVLAWIIGKELVADSLYKQSLKASTAAVRTRKQKLRQFFSFFIWRHKGIILSFILCAAVSIFFSFDSFFRNIYTDSQRSLAATTTARTQVQIITGEVENALKDARQNSRQNLISSQQWVSLKLRLNALTQNTKKIEGLVSLTQAENAAKLSGTSASLKSAIRLKTAELERFKADENQLFTSRADDVERVRLETLIADLRRRKAERQQDIENLATQIEDEIKTGQGKRRAGCGPVCRSLKKQIPVLEKKLDDVTSLLRQAEVRKIETNSRTTITNTALAAIRADIGSAETVLGTLNSNLEQISRRQKDGTGIVNFADRIKGLNRSIAQFEINPDQSALMGLGNSCTGIIDKIKSLNIPGDTQEFDSCNVTQVAMRVAAANFDQRITAAQAACNADLSTQSFAGVLGYGRKCLQVANLGKSLTGNYQRQLDRIALEYSAIAHPFERNLNAITSANKLAILAAVLALLIDLLIFMTGIFGARQAVGILATSAHPKPLDQENAVRWALGASTTLVGDEDEETLKAKIFLSFLEPMEEIKEGFMCQINLRRVTPPYLELVNSVLNSGPFFERTQEARVFLVSDTMYRHLTKTVFKFEENRKYASGASASASAARYTALAHNPHLVALQNQGPELDIVRAVKSATNSPSRSYTNDNS